MNTHVRYFFILGIIILPCLSVAQDLRLWYAKPAANWNEALPIGNGRLGAMIFGDAEHERLQLNEESVWTGRDEDFVNPEAKNSLAEIRKLLFEGKYAEANALAQRTMMGDKKIPSTYQSLGDVYLDMQHPEGEIENYVRILDIENAIATVTYDVNGISYSREYFSSAPAQAIIVRLTASSPASLSFSIRMAREKNMAEIREGNQFVMREQTGEGIGVKLVSRINVINEGGTLSEKEKGVLTVTHATQVVVVLTAATDYWGNDPDMVTSSQLNALANRTYVDLRGEHKADYHHYFKRVDFSLGSESLSGIPVDRRLEAFREGQEDQSLISLYYQFGRYLLISSSRRGGLPANLQGIWADGMHPPWDADYHININIQMNYWPAEITNLSEMHSPFFNFLEKLRIDGRKTARDMYGIDGSVAHFTSDAWHFTEPYGQTQWAMWPMGLAWSVRHIWEHYLFTEDADFLLRTFPIMKDAATFCMNYLVENPQTKKLVSGPSISPENTFKTKDGAVATLVMGPTMDHMIIRDLLQNTKAASIVLLDDPLFRKQIDKTLSQLAPLQLASDGRIMEWTEEFEEAEPGHRHISHLYALYPGNAITRHTPELMQAARKTIDYRLAHGGGHTGWSRAWIINFFARLHDGEAAHDNLLALLQKSTLPNLFDNHPPFQIDGNFGATAGITEMLIQSHANEVEVLPALPEAWKEGTIKGICARRGFELDIVWVNGKLKSVRVVSKLGNPLVLRYQDTIVRIRTKKGNAYIFDDRLVQQ